MSRFTLFSKSRRKMSCRRVGETLQAYLDGEIDDLSTRRIAHHLEDCVRCGMELEVYERIKASLQRTGGDVDDDALDRLRAFGRQLATSPDLEPGTDEGPSDD